MSKLIILILFSFPISLASCSSDNSNIAGGNTSLTELKRIASLDNKVEAVLVATNSGATVATGNLVFVVLPGKKISNDDERLSLFRADHCSGLDIESNQNQQLLIKYDKARIFSYSNFWQVQELNNWDYVVEVVLKCTSLDG